MIKFDLMPKQDRFNGIAYYDILENDVQIGRVFVDLLKNKIDRIIPDSVSEKQDVLEEMPALLERAFNDYEAKEEIIYGTAVGSITEIKGEKAIVLIGKDTEIPGILYPVIDSKATAEAYSDDQDWTEISSKLEDWAKVGVGVIVSCDNDGYYFRKYDPTILMEETVTRTYYVQKQ